MGGDGTSGTRAGMLTRGFGAAAEGKGSREVIELQSKLAKTIWLRSFITPGPPQEDVTHPRQP